MSAPVVSSIGRWPRRRRALACWTDAVRGWARDERGQDLIEYALLTGAIGVAAIATWPLISRTIGTAYRALDTNTQGLWEPPPPGGGP